jgi:hypothetical protein
MGQLKEVISFHCPFWRKFYSEFIFSKCPEPVVIKGKKIKELPSHCSKLGSNRVKAMLHSKYYSQVVI